MGTSRDQDFDPWVHLQQSQWQYLKLNAVTSPSFTNPIHQSTTAVLPTYVDPYGETTGVCKILPSELGTSNELVLPANVNRLGQFDSGIVPLRTNASLDVQVSSDFARPVDATVARECQRRFIIFDQAGNTTRFMFSSLTPVLRPSLASKGKQPNYCNLLEKLPVNNDLIENQSFETRISRGCEVNEMSENMEEIDALLYSDSEDEEEASTGYYSPVVSSEAEEEVASSGVPTKKRRLNNEFDEAGSLLDSASSAHFNVWQHVSSNCVDRNAELNSVKKTTELRVRNANGLTDGEDKSLKKDNIHETLDVLCRIIPGGGQGKDAVGILDEAILYLMSLKTKVFGSTR